MNVLVELHALVGAHEQAPPDHLVVVLRQGRDGRLDGDHELDGRLVWQLVRQCAMATHVYSELLCDYQQEYKGDIYEY